MAKLSTLKGLVGGSNVLLMQAVALFAPLVIPESYATQMDMRARLSGPTAAHIFGTDQLGRDLFYRVTLGGQTSIVIVGRPVLISPVIGLPLGVIRDTFGGWIDDVLMWLVDTLLAFPALLPALAISAVLGPNLTNTIIAIGIAFTPFLVRIIRSEALRVAQIPHGRGRARQPPHRRHVSGPYRRDWAPRSDRESLIARRDIP